MAINDYGKTVTDEIERNHKEVVFMYDMLNDKTTDLKNTIRKYESMKKTPAAQEKPNAASKAESGDNIHIPKMFAAPKGDKGKASTSKSASDDVAVSVVGGKYGQDVLRLHREGMSDIDIAKKLGIGVGEVRLAVSLSDAGGPNES